MNPFAYYDLLSIASKLDQRIGNAAESELHLFAYLGCLLSLYRHRPAAEWGYQFAGTRCGGPFSPDIDSAIGTLSSLGLLEESDGLYKITASGTEELSALGGLYQNQQREEFLDGACSCLLTLPIGFIRQAITADPEIVLAEEMKTPRPLLEGSSLDSLYDGFSMLSLKIGVAVKDLMVPATVWLTYLRGTAQNRTTA